jgi:hypothetical protein
MSQEATERKYSGSANGGPDGAAALSSPAFDRHYSVAEVAALWNLSVDAVRGIFRNEPGVLVLGDANSRRKRRYVTLRIPHSVLERVHRQMSLSKQYLKR